jgi:hypothetical protein
VRKKVPQSLRRKIVTGSAAVCCVCKTRGVGVNLHHIDGDPSNNDPANLAVICVKDHDAHHRPAAYHPCHFLSEDKLRHRKIEWEQFVARARSSPPRVGAVVNVIGSNDYIHAIRVAMQDENGQTGLERDFHFVDLHPEAAVDAVIDEVSWLNPSITLYLIDEVVPIEYCFACEDAGALTTVLAPGVAARELAPDWTEKSIIAVYINPARPSCAIVLTYNGTTVLQLSMHRCGDHLVVNESRHRLRRRPSARGQVTRVISDVVRAWRPGKWLIGTGDPDKPTIIEHLTLPRCWESPSPPRKTRAKPGARN